MIFLIILCYLFAMIKIKSETNDVFNIEEDVAYISPVIKNALSGDFMETDTITLPIPTNILDICLRYMTHINNNNNDDNFGDLEVNKNNVMEILKAADYLQI